VGDVGWGGEAVAERVGHQFAVGDVATATLTSL
jgi:hypothetical protein